MRREAPSNWQRDHWATCWTVHDTCAVRAAEAMLGNQIAQARAQRSTLLMALNRREGPLSPLVTKLARRLLEVQHGTDWKTQEAKT